MNGDAGPNRSGGSVNRKSEREIIEAGLHDLSERLTAAVNYVAASLRLLKLARTNQAKPVWVLGNALKQLEGAGESLCWLRKAAGRATTMATEREENVPLAQVVRSSATTSHALVREEEEVLTPRRLRELASWYREFAGRAGSPVIWEARIRTAENLDSEADRIERQLV